MSDLDSQIRAYADREGLDPDDAHRKLLAIGLATVHSKADPDRALTASFDEGIRLAADCMRVESDRLQNLTGRTNPRRAPAAPIPRPAALALVH